MTLRVVEEVEEYRLAHANLAIWGLCGIYGWFLTLGEAI
jgi:hypothetical protein